MLPTEWGKVRPASCRDKGRRGVDEGALCLSWWGCDRVASRNPDHASCHQDKHKAPTLLHVHPLSLQDGGRHSHSFPDSVVKNHQALDHDGPVFGHLETNLLVETCLDPHQKDHHKARGSRGRFCDRGIGGLKLWPCKHYVRTHQPLRETGLGLLLACLVHQQRFRERHDLFLPSTGKTS